MRSFPIGVMLPLNQLGPERTTARWTDLRAMALRAEELGFDTVWTPDEFLWLYEGETPQGWWEGVSMAGAVAAVTTTVTVGTWVLSALNRNPGITAKVAETLDEISGGRFIFGLGAGHTWPGQAHAFGLPEDAIFARFDEALRIIVPLIREGRVDYEGTYHVARDLRQIPVGPRPGRIPLLIGGNGPKGQRHAVRHADIWSGWIEDAISVEDMGAKITSLEAICAEEGRDPSTIGRSVGIVVDPMAPSGERPDVVSGSPQEIADVFRAFQAVGYTRLEMMFRPPTVEGIEALGEALKAFDAG